MEENAKKEVRKHVDSDSEAANIDRRRMMRLLRLTAYAAPTMLVLGKTRDAQAYYSKSF